MSIKIVYRYTVFQNYYLLQRALITLVTYLRQKCLSIGIMEYAQAFLVPCLLLYWHRQIIGQYHDSYTGDWFSITEMILVNFCKNLWTCLGRHDINRNNPICVTSSKVAKASTIVAVACPCCQHNRLEFNTNVNYPQGLPKSSLVALFFSEFVLEFVERCLQKTENRYPAFNKISPGANAIKLFSFLSRKGQNKLECFSMGPFQA